MKKSVFAAASVLVLWSQVGLANASVLKFDGFAEVGSTFDFRGSVILESGFTISNSNRGSDAFIQWTNSSGYDADPIGHTLAVNYGGTTTTITSASNSAFNFNSIDLGDVFNSGSGGDIRIDWDVFGGGTGSLLVALDALRGLQTFVVNALGVQTVKVTAVSTDGRWLQLDNVVVNGSVSAVPVPAALPLLISGLAGLVALRRRKRKIEIA